ncbi:putative polygalacturonase non-catalytic subunit [Abeliophyllum distichum]|uniref:Polygalacturonase non-catalytic subunit n=1 Tax=Abeliophyllum distichum TaxID=126358 RepID=A0ABD1T0R0_9LAMI
MITRNDFLESPNFCTLAKLSCSSVYDGFKKVKQAHAETKIYINKEAKKEEIKNCPKSLEEMITFSKFALNKNKLLALTSQSTRTAYFCHSISSSRIYAVDLVEAETRLSVNTMIAICHMDTSKWPENHVAFKILKFSPGEGEVCHWMWNMDLAWIADD